MQAIIYPDTLQGPRFLSVLLVVGAAGAALAADAVLAAADFVVFTFFLAAGAALVLEAAVVFLTTVEVLASLDSLAKLIFRLPRVAVVEGGGAAALRVRPVAVVAVVPALELAVEEAVAFLAVIAGRVALAFSTMLERIFEEALFAWAFIGDAGRLIIDFVGEAGRSLGKTRVLEDVGDRICDAENGAFGLATAPRGLFLGLSTASPWFSLLASDISVLECR